ncbi:nuclease-related domain-containing protein [Cytobacillus sp. FJAT-54145]|uniref:Nuclease-related domain-containing protein n=1 Tax=Cytobacillus spartinae TaxID=3299023 RepID=A0ABW6K901_9BACI
MIFKPRFESMELKILRYLKARMKLDPKDENHYTNLEKGYAGELQFDKLLEKLSNENLVINDLLLECNNTFFQIDTMLILSNTIYLFEIKNFEGDFYIEGDRWYSTPRSEIKNPLLQLKRNESLLRRLLQELGSNFPIEAHLVFLNPEFQLYQAPLNLPVIFPAQLNRYIEKISRRSSTIKNTHTKLAEQLLTLHISESPFSRIPEYTYEELEKGIICLGCGGFYETLHGTTLKCNRCGETEDHYSAVLRSIKELEVLFPSVKLTMKTLQDWCKVLKNKKTIKKIIRGNYMLVEKGKQSYYIRK